MKLDSGGMAAVLRQLRRRGGAAFECYKDSCLARRIGLRMRARGVGTLAGYAGLLARDEQEADRLRRALSVGVTGFFRNPDTWRRLREIVAAAPPGSPDRRSGWSMGCSTGEEAWSLAMVLVSQARRSGIPPEGTVRVVASDLDEKALAIAQAGNYPPTAGRAVREVMGEAWGTLEENRFQVGPELRGQVDFRREDLTGSLVLPDRHDVVCCRNLLIFLGREGQRRVITQALRALRPGGLLVLGRTESLAAGQAEELEPVDAFHRIYRRS